MAHPKTAPSMEQLSASLSKMPKTAKDIRERVELCRTLLPLFDRAKDSYLWAALQVELGFNLARIFASDRTDMLEQAIDAYHEALSVLTPGKNPTEWANTMGNLSLAYRDRIAGDPKENFHRAIEGFNKVLELSPRDKEPVRWAQTMANLGYAYEGLAQVEDRADNLERSIHYCEEALAILTKGAYPLEFAHAKVILGNGKLQSVSGIPSDNIEEAIHCYKSALEVYTRKDNGNDWALAQMNLGNAYQRRIAEVPAESLESAISCYHDALDVFATEGNAMRSGETNMNLGNAYRRRIRGDRLENQELAIQAYEAALQLLEKKNKRDWGLTEMNLGNIYAERGRGNHVANFLSAIQAYQKALEVFTRDAEPLLWAKVKMNLGTVYGRQDSRDKEAAVEAFESALEVFRHDEHPIEWAQAKINLAAAYQSRISENASEDIEKAIESYEEVVTLFPREAGPTVWATAARGVAKAYQSRISGNREGNVQHALKGFYDALGVYELKSWPREHLKTQLDLAMLLFKERRWKEAAESFRAALAAHSLLYGAAATPEARQAELREVRRVSEHLAYALAKGGDLVEAVVVLERGRARGLVEALELDEAPLDRLLAPDRDAFDKTRTWIHLLQTEARLPEDTPAKRSFIVLSEELHAAYADLEKLIADIRERFPQFLPETNLTDIQAAASSAPFVYALTTEVGGLAIVIPPNSDAKIAPVWLPEFTERSLMEHLVAYFGAHSAWSVVPADESKREAWFLALDSTAQWLWQVAMGPIVEALASFPRAVLIPTGFLSLLPLHASWKEDKSKPTGRHYALDSLAFSYAPSAKSLLAVREVASSTVPNEVLAIEEPRPVWGGPLPSSEDEVMVVTSSFADHHVLRHEQATREAVLAALPKYSVLHFACHGSADFRQPLNSGMAMANYQSLTLRNFLDLHLPQARLAVLSACETGLPGTELPDEVLSLPAGPLQAGVAGIAASLWSVADISTMMLMARFYDLWRKGVREPVEALREAQQWLTSTAAEMKLADWYEQKYEVSRRSDPDAFAWMTYYRASPQVRPFEHPYFWGGFFFTGV